jgi:hypothetical protein
MKGLENLAPLRDNDFAFRIAGRAFKCNRVLAALLCPRVNAILQQDPTIDEFSIDLDSGATGYAEAMQMLPSLTRNWQILLTETNFDAIKEVVRSLGNPKLCKQVMQFARNRAELDCANVIKRLKLADELEVSPSEEIDYLAAHFYELSPELLNDVNEQHFGAVVRSDRLRISAEDSLLDGILDRGYFDLLGCVRLEYLTRSGMERLVRSIVPEADRLGLPQEVGGELWSNIFRCLLLCNHSAVASEPRFHVQEFPLPRWSPRNHGIFWHLTSETGGNVATKGIVSITASDGEFSQCHNLVDRNAPTSWNPFIKEEAWLQFDFKDRRISPDCYVLELTTFHELEWVTWSLEGSNDGLEWKYLDTQRGEALVGHDARRAYMYQLKESASSYYRFLRLARCSPIPRRHLWYSLSDVEFFGRIMRV